MRGLLWGAVAMLVAGAAMAEPIQLTHQGRVLDAAGQGVNRAEVLSVGLHESPDDTTPLFQEEILVTLADGYYSVQLGTDTAENPLDSGLFDGSPRYVEVAIAGAEPLGPRAQLTSVPFAARAQTASSVDGGPVNASEVRVNGEVVIDDRGNIVGTLVGDEDTLRDLGCTAGDIVQRADGDWLCVPLEGSHQHSADEVGLGPTSNGNPLNHVRYADSEAVAAMGNLANDNPRNHTRFTAADAVAAMGARANGNPLNHNRPGGLSCTTVSGLGTAGACWGASKVFCPSGTIMTGGGIQQNNQSLEQSRPCTDAEGQCFVCDNTGGCGTGTCFVRCCSF